MHIVIQNHLKQFMDSHNITSPQSKAFEAFAAYAIAGHFWDEPGNPEELVYEGPDPGIDSLLIFVNRTNISTGEEIDSIFKSKKRDNVINIVFMQAKTTDFWAKADLNVFEVAVLNFISNAPMHELAEHLKEKKVIFDKIFKEVGKVKNGKPNLHCYFTTCAAPNIAIEIDKGKDAFTEKIKQLGFFHTQNVVLMGRDDLIKMYHSSIGNYETTFTISGSAPFPRSPGIEESYVVTVSAKEFVDKVLRDSDGNLKKSLFEENVRDFIDFKKSPINEAIRRSLTGTESTKRFGILNNGVTIISPDVRLRGHEMSITNFQIVNGCQTSNVLFHSAAEIGDIATLMVKIIETEDQKIYDEIVESTNSQNKIENYQFLARIDCLRGIESYFKARCENDSPILFFERRPNQYNNLQDVSAKRIFNIKELARCCGAMFFDCPELSARYPAQLVGHDLSKDIFDIKNKEEIFFVSALSQYRLGCLLSEDRIDPIFKKFRWHALMAIKYYVNGKSIPLVTDKKVRQACKEIEDFVLKTDQYALGIWRKIAGVIKSTREATTGDVRTPRFTQDLIDKIVLARSRVMPRQRATVVTRIKGR